MARKSTPICLKFDSPELQAIADKLLSQTPERLWPLLAPASVQKLVFRLVEPEANLKPLVKTWAGAPIYAVGGWGSQLAGGAQSARPEGHPEGL